MIQQAAALPVAVVLARSTALSLPPRHCAKAQSVCLEADVRAQPWLRRVSPQARDACGACAHALLAVAVAVKRRKP